MCKIMKKIVTILLAFMAVAAQALTVQEAAGTYKGLLNIGGQEYPNKEVYILPGTEANSITFVLPDFRYNGAPLGDIVLVNLPMSAEGQLSLEDATLYIRAISERATISVINGLEDGGTVYNSVITSSSAQVLLSIGAPSLPEDILVLFAGTRENSKNYAVTNGGFEGSWSNGEPTGWHSFNSATGDYVSFVQNTEQFTQSSEVRPGSTGSHSAMIQTKIVVGNNANGNCTNGRINAGSMTATDASGNYNFSDPSANGYNTAFAGNPDSLVFWAKYIPADQNPSNSVNKARAHAVITTNARYQDPEATSYASVKIAEAEVNYSATSSMGWQRLAVPFSYSAVDPSTAAYMLITFTTNMTPGGGSSYSSGGLFNKTYYLDNVYLDDVEMVYNHALSSLTVNGEAVSFHNGEAVSALTYSDSEYNLQATTNGKASKSFIGYDAQNYRAYVYVVADNYSQAGGYSVYALQMAEPIAPVVDTEYAYEASICAGESYSDELFIGLTEGGVYGDTIPNSQGGDSIITFTLTVLPTYSFPETGSITMDESFSWRGKSYQDLEPGIYYDTLRLQTKAGCDSLFMLMLTVGSIGYLYEDERTACAGEPIEWRERTIAQDEAGVYIFHDSLKSVYGTDSVFALTLTVLPKYSFTETLRVNTIDTEWHGQLIQGLEPAEAPYIYHDSLHTTAGCDSVFTLLVYVSAVPITYGDYEAVLCEGDEVTVEGTTYYEAFSGDVYSLTSNTQGGDSIIHLTVTVLPNYIIDEFMTLMEGDEGEWEGWTLNTTEPGEQELTALYYSEAGCDSTMVLHLTVLPIPNPEGTEQVDADGHQARKILYNGRIYIIRKDDSIYDIIGKRIQ